MMVLPPYLKSEVSISLSPMDLTSFVTGEQQKMHSTHTFLKEPEKAAQPHMQDHAAVLYDEHWWIGSSN